MTSTTPRPAPSISWVTGWVGYAGLMMVIGGAMNALTGLVALVKDEVYAGDQLIIDLTLFGWAHLILGAAVAATGVFLLRGARWAVAAGVAVTTLNLLTQTLLLPAYPLWSLIIITIDLIVLAALMTRGADMDTVS